MEVYAYALYIAVVWQQSIPLNTAGHSANLVTCRGPLTVAQCPHVPANSRRRKEPWRLLLEGRQDKAAEDAQPAERMGSRSLR